jgi:hypothetical protein
MRPRPLSEVDPEGRPNRPQLRRPINRITEVSNSEFAETNSTGTTLVNQQSATRPAAVVRQFEKSFDPVLV